MADLSHVHATETQVQERCQILADADLVAFLTEDSDMVELTTWGKLYLEGEIDVEHRRWPRQPDSVSEWKN